MNNLTQVSPHIDYAQVQMESKNKDMKDNLEAVKIFIASHYPPVPTQDEIDQRKAALMRKVEMFSQIRTPLSMEELNVQMK